MQRFLDLGLQEVRPPQMTDKEIVKRVPTFLDAIRVSMNLSGTSHQKISNELEVDKGHMSRILSGKANFSLNKLKHLMMLCGTLLPLQWLAYQMGYDLVKREKSANEIKDEELKRLQKEVETLRKQA